MKFYIETYGCSANRAESETMSGLLAAGGHIPVSAVSEADAVIVNTCFVKAPTEQKIKDRIRNISREHAGKRLVVAGCMPEVALSDIEKIAPAASIVSTHHVTRIAEAIEGRAVFVGPSEENKLNTPKSRTNRLIGITEISEGCNGVCAYCAVRLAKGRLRCFPPDDIVKDVKTALDDGCREIWLTSQDNGSYAYDGIKLPDLIDRICSLDGDFMVRIGMMNPNHAGPMIDRLIEAFSSRKVYRFLHLPVQSGSDRVLKAMRRKYTASQFEHIVDKFRKAIPSITIATDVIVGFPGETDEDFQKTMELLEKTKPDIVNVSKFGVRRGTEAARMPQLDPKTVKRRSAEMAEAVRKLRMLSAKKWLGWKGSVLVTERGKAMNQYTGRNRSYRAVVINSDRDILGTDVTVQIKGAHAAYLEASYRQQPARHPDKQRNQVYADKVA